MALLEQSSEREKGGVQRRDEERELEEPRGRQVEFGEREHNSWSSFGSGERRASLRFSIPAQ